jgi:tyrosinase
MKKKHHLKVRRSLQELQDDYKNGNKKPLEDLMRAWKGIKELPPENPQSFFILGGFHGEPFRGAGWGNSSFWGGYCNHGNVLFPTWHRVYIYKVEEALQSIPGCKDVMLPYWDQTSEDSLKNGIPWALTDKEFNLDGKNIPNPLRSFAFPKGMVDNINGDNPNYSKPAGYETVRYPLSGLVGSREERDATDKHNSKYSDYNKNVALLNQNIVNWLSSHVVIAGKIVPTGVKTKYEDCLHAPNYTVFSNTTSAQEWNANLRPGEKPVVPLESPHNNIHLAVGGYDVPSGPNAGDFSPIDGANADMGENDTAALDPIFYFHHCNVDRVFWLWQKKNGSTDKLEIIPEFPGTNTVDSQGPTAGFVPNTWLTLDSPLTPFHKTGSDRYFTSKDCINIEKQLGLTYSSGSLEEPKQSHLLAEENSTQIMRVSGINRAPVRGSFLINAYARIGNERYLIGTEAVLSRWSVKYCANCQTHLEVKAFFGLERFHTSLLEDASYEVEVRSRDGIMTAQEPNRKGVKLTVRFSVH